jgi:hypothetical protein
MKPGSRSLVGLACAVLVALSATACKKRNIEAEVAETAHQLPGAAAIMASIDKKNYDEAIAGLLKIRQGATSEEQMAQFAVLAREARDKIRDTGGNDPKAAEAVQLLRNLSTGR